ncbi:MAG: helicase C-terminal domain-containing protein [Vulcanimicrobiota bacterium]
MPTRSGPDSEIFLERVRSFFQQILPLRPDYEERPEQLEMALGVARALADQELLVVEAGTGTGKSLAYLIPCLLWAFEHGGPVVISTRTLNLQQQLLEKDIPLLRELLEQPFKATAARGWSNYVCLRRLDSLQSSQQVSPELSHEAVQLAEVLGLGGPGVRQKLPVSEGLWNLVQADSHACNRQLCPHYQECYLFRERREMERSELIIANHSLVMADVALRAAGAQGILPKPTCWVLDEGHHLEEVANDHLGRSLSLADLQRLRQNVFDPKGKANEAGWLPMLRDRLSKADQRARLLECLDRGLLVSLPGFYQVGEEFFHWLTQSILLGQTELGARVTLNPDFFHSAEGEECRRLSEQWAGHMEHVETSARDLHRLLTELELEVAQGGLVELQSLIERLKSLRENLEFCMFPDSGDWVYWAVANANNASLGATPLDVGERLAAEFFGPARSMVITSATLAVGKDLSFYEQRVGLDLHQNRVARSLLDSPFNFKENAYLGVATDLNDPNRPDFWERSQEALLWLLQQLGGRTFLLATSHASLRLARERLSEPLSRLGIRVLSQGQAPPGLLLEEFRRDSRALLIGADSFWEGVDVVGDDLSCVLITRLPFRVPNDPLVQAHCRRLEEEGKSSFQHYSLPQAILRFRQGFGRLIRSQKDRGMVLVLDSRLYHKSYGSEFLGALPACNRRAGRLAGLVQDAIKWLKGFD